MVGLVAALPSLAGAAGQPDQTSSRPNVVVFITDDESWLERSAYGWSKIPTPAFDRVAKSGVLFTHAYSSAPSCAPARASLLTGRNFWELEQGAFIQAWLPAKYPVYPELLASQGYAIGRIGKGWGPGTYPKGAHGHNSAGPIPHTIKVAKPEKAMNPMDYAANFKAFLDDKPKEQPFCYWVGVTEPHGPYAPNNHVKLKDRYGVTLDQVGVPGFMPDTPAIRRERGNFIYEICYADQQLGQILDILEQRGELDNTLLIVTSDNGTATVRSKATPYDWGVHVPLAIMWPKQVTGGRTVEDFVNFPDLAPTILQAAGATIPSDVSGHSLLDILTSGKSGQVDPNRDVVVTGLEWHGELPPQDRASRMIRDKRYEYVVNYGRVSGYRLDPKKVLPDSEFAKTSETANLRELVLKHPDHPAVKPFVPVLTTSPSHEELFDLEKDPWQLHNLADDPAYAEIKGKMQKRLEEYQKQTGDPRVTGQMETFEQTRKFVHERKAAGYAH